MRGEIQQGGGSFRNRFGGSLYRGNDGDFQINEGERGDADGGRIPSRAPEGVCALCDSKVAAEFQKKGDWCKQHDRPESQCFICHPEPLERVVVVRPGINDAVRDQIVG